MEIIRLEEKNHYYDMIVNWMYHWWGIRDGRKKEEVAENIAHCLNINNRLPQTYIALIEGNLAGVYMIAMNDDLESRPDIYPWIINVYVDEKYRNRHVFKTMMESVNDHAKQLGLSELYLYTKHIGLYEKYGWEFVEYVNTYRDDSPVERLYHLTIK